MFATDTYHIFHCAQILGTLGVAVVFGQVCSGEAVLVPYAQVHSIDHKDLTALESRKRKCHIEMRWRK